MIGRTVMPGQLQWDSTGFPVISQSRDMKRNSDRSYRRWLGTRYLDKTVSASRREIVFGRYPRRAESEAARQRHDEISISAFETLNAPRVGFDRIADDWAKATHADRRIAK